MKRLAPATSDTPANALFSLSASRLAPAWIYLAASAIALCAVAPVVGFAPIARAQDASADGASSSAPPVVTSQPPQAGAPADIEELFEGEAKTAEPKELPPQPVAPNPQAAGASGADASGASAVAPSPAASVRVKKITDLTGLAPFSDIAMIQKRYLPKTGRFEFFGGGSGILNDPFFINAGLNLRLGYYFVERWGIEADGMLLTTLQRASTQGLANLGITTQSLVSPTNYFGLDVKWTPIYGKVTLLNHSIVPFDLYFSLGAGETGTNQGTEAPTLHLGTGQIYAITKAFAARWDLSWNMYSSTSGVASSSGSSIYNNVFMTVGVSYFFPEANYR